MKSEVYSLTHSKNDNRTLIFRQIRQRPISRSDIAKNAGICKSSVTTLTNEMIHQGLLTEIGAVDTGVGRRPVLLDIVADYRYVIGVGIGEHSFICISDLKSNTIVSAEVEPSDDAQAFSQVIIKKIQELLSVSHIVASKCIGIGIGISHGWENWGVLVKRHLEHAFAIPVSLETNTDLLCKSHANSQNGTCLLIMLDEELHSSLAINGTILKECNIEHFSVDCNGIPCDCGACGCLGKYVSGHALQQNFGKTHYTDALRDTDVTQYICNKLSYALASIKSLISLQKVIICIKRKENEALTANNLMLRLQDTFSPSIEFELVEISPSAIQASICSFIITDYFEKL